MELLSAPANGAIRQRPAVTGDASQPALSAPTVGGGGLEPRAHTIFE